MRSRLEQSPAFPSAIRCASSSLDIRSASTSNAQTGSQVFLDAIIVIAAGKPPGGPEIMRVADLVEAGIITVVTTDLAIIAIAKKHAENDFQLIKDFARPHVRRALEKALQMDIPEMTRNAIRQRLIDQHSDSITAMIGRLKAETLSINDVEPRSFSMPTRGEKVFSGEGKKDQFPEYHVARLAQEHRRKHSAAVLEPSSILAAAQAGERPVFAPVTTLRSRVLLLRFNSTIPGKQPAPSNDGAVNTEQIEST